MQLDLTEINVYMNFWKLDRMKHQSIEAPLHRSLQVKMKQGLNPSAGNQVDRGGFFLSLSSSVSFPNARGGHSDGRRK